jgi:hypothetical protein
MECATASGDLSHCDASLIEEYSKKLSNVSKEAVKADCPDSVLLCQRWQEVLRPSCSVGNVKCR